MLWYNHMCLLIWTVFSGERCGPWASCFLLPWTREQTNLTVIVVKWRWSQNMCPTLPFCMKYIGKIILFVLNFDYKKTNSFKFWKIDKWYLYGYCLYISKKKMGVTVELLKKGYFKLWKCVTWEEVWSKMFQKEE